MGRGHFECLLTSITDDKGEIQLFDVPGGVKEECSEGEGEDGGASSMWIPSDLSGSEEEVNEREISQENVSHPQIRGSPSSEAIGEYCVLVLAGFTNFKMLSMCRLS